jgi:hypothetical protein
LTSNSEGLVLAPLVLESGDRILALEIGKGTTALTADGRSLDEISIEAVTENLVPETLDNGFIYAGYAYDLGPDAATFDPAVRLSFHIPSGEWREEAVYQIQWQNETGGVWQDTMTTINPAVQTISAEISHFSIYALYIQSVEMPVLIEPPILQEYAESPVAPPGGQSLTITGMFVTWIMNTAMHHPFLVAAILAMVIVATYWFRKK